MVKWNKVCQPKATGSLGLWHVEDINMAFMTKIVWGLIHKKDELWARVVRAKYGCGDGVIPCVRSQHVCSNLWKGVHKDWP